MRIETSTKTYVSLHCEKIQNKSLESNERADTRHTKRAHNDVDDKVIVRCCNVRLHQRVTDDDESIAPSRIERRQFYTEILRSAGCRASGSTSQNDRTTTSTTKLTYAVVTAV